MCEVHNFKSQKAMLTFKTSHQRFQEKKLSAACCSASWPDIHCTKEKKVRFCKTAKGKRTSLLLILEIRIPIALKNQSKGELVRPLPFHPASLVLPPLSMTGYSLRE